MILDVIKGVLKGKTIYRTLSNLSLKHIKLDGEGIDLGAKSNKSSYYKFLNITPGTNITYTDWFSEEPEILRLDLEKPFLIQNESKDFVILMNVLEHLYNYNNCISESFKILKKNSPLIGVVPFIHKIHPDPDDYYRYTKSSLERIFKEAGFSDVTILPLSIGPLTTSISLVFPLIPTRFFKAFITVILYCCDKVLLKLFNNHPGVRKDYFPLGYFFYCIK